MILIFRGPDRGVPGHMPTFPLIPASPVYPAVPDSRGTGERDGVQRSDRTGTRAFVPAGGLVGSGLAGGPVTGCRWPRAGHLLSWRSASISGRAPDAPGGASAVVGAGPRHHLQLV